MGRLRWDIRNQSTEIYSSHNEGKLSATQQFIRTL